MPIFLDPNICILACKISVWIHAHLIMRELHADQAPAGIRSEGYHERNIYDVVTAHLHMYLQHAQNTLARTHIRTGPISGRLLFAGVITGMQPRQWNQAVHTSTQLYKSAETFWSASGFLDHAVSELQSSTELPRTKQRWERGRGAWKSKNKRDWESKIEGNFEKESQLVEGHVGGERRVGY